MAGTVRIAQAGPINIAALGWGLSAALVAIFVLCAVVGMIFPSAPLAHSWLTLFSTAPMGSPQSFAEGIVGSAAFAWVTTLVLGSIYNWLARR